MMRIVFCMFALGILKAFSKKIFAAVNVIYWFIIV